jgi:hypothetical protein
MFRLSIKSPFLTQINKRLCHCLCQFLLNLSFLRDIIDKYGKLWRMMLVTDVDLKDMSDYLFCEYIFLPL